MMPITWGIQDTLEVIFMGIGPPLLLWFPSSGYRAARCLPGHWIPTPSEDDNAIGEGLRPCALSCEVRSDKHDRQRSRATLETCCRWWLMFGQCSHWVSLQALDEGPLHGPRHRSGSQAAGGAEGECWLLAGAVCSVLRGTPRLCSGDVPRCGHWPESVTAPICPVLCNKWFTLLKLAGSCLRAGSHTPAHLHGIPSPMGSFSGQGSSFPR